MAESPNALFRFIFSGASMRRWNDKLRPVELYEIDKQAHKMIVAWMLFEVNSRKLPLEERLELGHSLIEQGLFDYLYRLVITDIKPPIFYRIKANAEQYAKLTEWVLGRLQPLIEPLYPEFWQRLRLYHTSPPRQDLAEAILRAAHGYASRWEFSLIAPLNFFDEEAADITTTFTNNLIQLGAQVPGIHELTYQGTALGRFANLCGQLRFQVRWSQTPRMPETNVLGHMFLVAAFSYFLSLELGACKARRINNFFCGLFHDLPELLTRDIISPVKKSVPELAAIIKDCENQEMQRRVLGPLEAGGHGYLVERLNYYLGSHSGSEFDESVIEHGQARQVDFESLSTMYNHDRFDPKDGRLLKLCDIFAAYLEARTSLESGVSSPHLYEAITRITGDAPGMTAGPIRLEQLIADCLAAPRGNP